MGVIVQRIVKRKAMVQDSIYATKQLARSSVDLIGIYGKDCAVYCNEQDSDSGHYSCAKQDGSEICYSRWFGENCTVFCKTSDDDSGHYFCNDTSGHRDFLSKRHETTISRHSISM